MLRPRRVRPIARGLIVSFIFAIVLQAHAHAQPLKVGKSSTSSLNSDEAERSKVAADVLKSKDLRRSGLNYIVGTEIEVQRKLSAARSQLALFRKVAAQQNALDSGMRDRKTFVGQMLQQRAMLNQQLAEVDRQMPPERIARNNFAVNAVRNELVDQHNQLVATINAISDRLAFIRGQENESELKERMAQEVARNREAYMQTVIDTRRLIDEAKRKYDRLSKDPEVARALQSLNENPKSTAKLKLGPSREFLSNVTAFEKVESSVLTEQVEVRKKDGVYWLDVTFNGNVTKPMVFDTGAGITTLSASLASEIGLKPKPSDPTIRCETADGSVVEAKQLTVGSMRVGKFTVKDVVCAIMPPDKGDVSPLLGQSFHRHFTYQFTPESGRLKISQVDEGNDKAQSAPQVRKKGASRARRGGRATSRDNTGFNLDEIP
jgi:clan AA aspartic protease (TIGR02281 family)